MKTNTFKSSLLAVGTLFALNTKGQDIDLAPGINYAYDPADAQGVIDISEVNVCNNGNDNASAFDISMYLYDENTTDHWVIATERLNPGLSGNSCVPAQNWTIDIDNTSGIPAGTYRLGVWVDSGEEISETDENNNTGLLDGDNTYTPATSSIKEKKDALSKLSTFPNPASNNLNVQYALSKNAKVSIKIYDMSGRKVYTKAKSRLQQGNYLQKIDISGLEKGIYSLTLEAGKQTAVKKIAINQ